MCVVSYFKTGMVFSCLLVMVGCGGGSSSGGDQKKTTNPSSVSSSVFSSQSSSSSSAKINQTLDFELDGEVIILVGERIDNRATGEGTGVIHYTSDNPDVVTASGTGRIFATNQPGSATITASIAADGSYAAATASYRVKVIPETIPVSIWIGEDDSLIDFPSNAMGFEFHRTTESGCDINTTLDCDNAQMNIIAQPQMVDSVVTTGQVGFYALKQGKYKGDLAVSHLSGENMGRARLPASSNHDVFVHDGKLWLIGDNVEDINNLNVSQGIWTSVDGVQWRRESMIRASAQIDRFSHHLYSFNNKIWMIGGDMLGAEGKSVYSLLSQPQGFSWEPVDNENIFAWRIGHQGVVFNNKLWVIGGREKDASKNNVWSSVDGNEWVEESAGAAFSARFYHQVVVFNSKLWLIGGRDSEYKNDVWSSVDGVNWVEETGNAAFSPREKHQVVTFNNKLWLIGGGSSVNYNDVWSSTDGVNWVQELVEAPFSARDGHQVVSFNDRLFLVGGNDGEDQNDVWSSTDGISWRKSFVGTFEIIDTSAPE